MNISKFLFSDALLASAVIPVLFLLQSRKKNSPLLKSPNKKQLLEKSSIKLPDKEKILELENVSKAYGNEIKFDSLIGNWKFIYVCRKETDEEDSLFSSLLRLFSAYIKLKKNISPDNSNKFSIITSIQFGFLSIVFSGSGYLTGKRPNLIFFFNTIEFRSGAKVILSRSLREPIEKEKSFFSLIALDKSAQWLAARGPQGSLILWLKD